VLTCGAGYRSVIGQQQHYLVGCEARAWSLNRLLPPDGPAPAAAAPPPPHSAAAGGAPDDEDAAAAEAAAWQVTKGMARRGKERAAGRAGDASCVARAGAEGRLGFVGRLRRSSSHGGEGGGLADMVQQN
jgi:hypothetical protein